VELRTTDMPMPWALALAMAIAMACLATTWPMPFRPSRTVAVLRSRTTSTFVTGFRMPSRIRSM